jgi:very-short-patch-repair endonuclease
MEKKLHEEHPETHPNRRLAKNKDKWTYPERVAAKCLEDLGVGYTYNKKIDKYYPDFLLDNTNIIIEIDGEQWHDADKDAIRDKRLNDLGYIVYRIKAKSDIVKEVAIIVNNISV